MGQKQKRMVEIRDEYRKSLPFGNLQSRNGVATVLCYYGYWHDVCDLM